MQKLLLSTFVILSWLVLSGCETAEDNSLESARKCVDDAAKLVITNNTAAKALAATCEQQAYSMTSKESGKIGFAAVLILEDKFTLLSTIASSISSGSNKLANGISPLIFTGNTANTNYGKMVNTYAPRSQSAGLQKVADMAKIANITASLGATDATSIETTIAGLTPANANTPGTSEYQIVQAALSMQSSSCSGSGATSSTCALLTQAVGSNTSNYAAVMSALQTYAAGSN